MDVLEREYLGPFARHFKLISPPPRYFTALIPKSPRQGPHFIAIVSECGRTNPDGHSEFMAENSGFCNRQRITMNRKMVPRRGLDLDSFISELSVF